MSVKPCRCGHHKYSHFDETRWCDFCECVRYQPEGVRLRDLIIPNDPKGE